MQTSQIKFDDSVKMPQVLENAAQFPEIFYCRHMFPGLCGYEDEDILIDVDTMKKMLPSMVGKPVYVEHQQVDLKNLQKQADGYVVKAFYNPNDGWAWAQFIVVSDEGMTAVRNGWSVSNAYMPTEWGAGGTSHNVDYDRKIVNASFTHLALVPNPRYENAQIYTPDQFKAYQEERQNELRNSKSGDKPMLKLFTKKTEEIKNANDVTEDTYLKVGDKHVTIGEMINAVKKNDEDEKKKKEEDDCMNKKNKKNDMEDDEFFNEDQDINIGDIKMPLKDLVSKFNAIQEKKNAEKMKADKENAEKEKEEKEKMDKKNAEEKADEKKNAKYFEELKNAKEVNGLTESSVVELSMDRNARGKRNYGSQA